MASTKGRDGLKAKVKELSQRERQILGLSAAGLLDKQIAAELNISINTLRTYWGRIREKSGELPRTALVAEYVKGDLAAKGARLGSRSNVLLSDTQDPESLRGAVIYLATALQRVDETLRRAARASRVLAAYPGIAFSAHDEGALLQSVCQILVQEGGYVMAGVGFPVQDEEKSVVIAESFGDAVSDLRAVKVSWGDGPHGRGPLGTCIRTGHAQVAQDVLASNKMKPWRDVAIKHGFQSVIGLPLQKGQNVLGGLAVYAVEPDAFDSTEVNVLTAISVDVSERISQLRATDRRLRSALSIEKVHDSS